MNRAYSILEVKSVNEDERVITGMATTPSPDRMGDIVEPLGASFAAELPLLWQHRHDQPVGTVRFGKPTAKGIPFTATVAKIAEAGVLKDRVDEAWQSVKARLVRAVSIGFRALEYVFMDDGGTRFVKSEIIELSLVTIPANAEATIQAIKQFDAEALAASGRDVESVVSPCAKGSEPPSGKTVTKKVAPVVRLSDSGPKEATKMKISEQITSFKSAREQKHARMLEIMKTSGETGETLDAAQTEEYDGLEAEVKSIDAHLKRLESMQAIDVQSATQVKAGGGVEEGALSRGAIVQVKAQPKLNAGIAFTRIAKVKALAKIDGDSVREKARDLYGEQSDTYGFFTKAAVPAGNTGNANWAGNLVGEESSAFADFVEFLRPQTILGRFGTGNVPALRRVPFRVALIGETSGMAGYWVGEGKAKPLTKGSYSRTHLEPLKVANIAVLTEEVLRDSSPSAEGLVRDGLASALRARLDTDFIDPAKAAAVGISPASITNGVTPVPSAGPTADDVRNDIRSLMATFIAANNAPSSGVYIMSALTALSLSLMQNPLGQSEFPGLGITGGTLLGFPVIVSEYVPTNTAGSYVFLVNASDIYFADDGGIAVDFSREASLEMDDAPTHDSVTPTETSLVSMFQTNSVAFRAERTLNWAKRRPSAVAVLSGVNWGAGS